VKRAVGFKDKKPTFRKIPYKPEQLIEVSYPTSDVLDLEARARGLLGVKHGPIAEQLGVSNKWVAERVGVGNYGKARLDKATEEDKYPELVYEQGVDAESLQEKAEGEKKKAKNAAKQMEGVRNALEKLSSSFTDSIKGVLSKVEDRFLRESQRSDQLLTHIITSGNKKLEEKPINITVEPPIVNVPESKSDITIVDQRPPKSSQRKFRIQRDEEGLVKVIEEEEEPKDE
jgi:hypothetical protein